ncbi:MAG TPA: MBL fold metallo-hydrolase [Pirellulales bacterium]
MSRRSLTLALLWGFCLLPLSTPTTGEETTEGKLVVTCLEIPDIQRGVGLAIVLQTPGGHTFLYDTGTGYPDNDGWVGNFNAGRDSIAPLLKSLDVTQIDGVAISHAHLDHFGGLLWLVDHVPIKKLFDSGYTFMGEATPDYANELARYDRVRERFAGQPGAYQAAHAGDKLPWDDQLEIEVISPPAEFFSEPHPERRPAKDPPAHYLVNANSLGLRIRHGKVVLLLPGDIQAEDQLQSLLPSVPAEKLRCQVLIAPGHGIHSVPEFALATRPEVTVASVFTRYARTSPALRVYGDVGSKVYLTGLSGAVRIVSDGVHYTVTTERPDPSPAKQ